MDALNADFSARLLLRARYLPWEDSPAPGVQRKRLHRVGPPESGQVTSIVRYAPGSSFPAHPHPDGEEILVLDGVFSDVRGDHGPGTWLANPEGFVHAPCSEPGCLLFVKLRQYPGVRPQMALDVVSDAAARTPMDGGGWRVSLLDDVGFGERIEVLGLPAETSIDLSGDLEAFVMQGNLELDGEILEPHDFFRLPTGDTVGVETRTDCVLWLKRFGMPILTAHPETG